MLYTYVITQKVLRQTLSYYEPAIVKNFQIFLNGVGPVLWALLNRPVFGMQ